MGEDLQEVHFQAIRLYAHKLATGKVSAPKRKVRNLTARQPSLEDMDMPAATEAPKEPEATTSKIPSLEDADGPPSGGGNAPPPPAGPPPAPETPSLEDQDAPAPVKPA